MHHLLHCAFEVYLVGNVDVKDEVKQPPPPTWKLRPRGAMSSLNNNSNTGDSTSSTSISVCTASLSMFDHSGAVSCTAVGEMMDTAFIDAVDTVRPKTSNVTAAASTATGAAFDSHASTCVSTSDGADTMAVSTSTMSATSGHMTKSATIACTTTTDVGNTISGLPPLFVSTRRHDFFHPESLSLSGKLQISSRLPSKVHLPVTVSSTSSSLIAPTLTGGKT